MKYSRVLIKNFALALLATGRAAYAFEGVCDGVKFEVQTSQASETSFLTQGSGNNYRSESGQCYPFSFEQSSIGDSQEGFATTTKCIEERWAMRDVKFSQSGRGVGNGQICFKGTGLRAFADTDGASDMKFAGLDAGTAPQGERYADEGQIEGGNRFASNARGQGRVLARRDLSSPTSHEGRESSPPPLVESTAAATMGPIQAH